MTGLELQNLDFNAFLYCVFQPRMSKENVKLSSQPFCGHDMYNYPYSMLVFSSRFTFLWHQVNQKSGYYIPTFHLP